MTSRQGTLTIMAGGAETALQSVAEVFEPLAAFGLANSLGYANQISNRVVDAIGDLAGGVRLYDAEYEAGR